MRRALTALAALHAADLEARAFEIARVAGGWMFRTRPAYAPAIRAAGNVSDQQQDLSEFDTAVLAAIAWYQPITRDGLKDIFGKLELEVRHFQVVSQFHRKGETEMIRLDTADFHHHNGY